MEFVGVAVGRVEQRAGVEGVGGDELSGPAVSTSSRYIGSCGDEFEDFEDDDRGKEVCSSMDIAQVSRFASRISDWSFSTQPSRYCM